MGLVKSILKFLNEIDCKCHSTCCDCDLNMNPEEFEEIIKEALKMVENREIFKYAVKIVEESDL